MRERVTNRIVSHAERALEPHQVDNKDRRRNEEQLHACVVHTYEVHEEIHVAQAEDQQVDFLGLARQA